MRLANPAIGERAVLQGQCPYQWDSLHGSLAIGEGFHEGNKKSASDILKLDFNYRKMYLVCQ